MRLFFALWPPRDAAAALSSWASEVVRQTGGKPTPLDNIHLTLAFLGEADAQAARRAAEGIRSDLRELPIENARYVRRNEMVWAGPERMPQGLATLVAQLHGGLRAAQFRLEDRPFAAHVTLVRKARPPQALPPLPAVEWPVSEFLLARSRTSPKGSTYEPVERFALA